MTSPPGATVALSSAWRAAPADEGLRRTYQQPTFDDGQWAEVEVPGHWQRHPDLAGCDGPVLYRTRFDRPTPEPGTRTWLVLDGVFYQSDVWLDGSYLGDTEGYFFPHQFEVTDQMAARADHVLAAEVACTPPGDRTAKRNLTGVFQHWDAIDDDVNVGGIWRPVRVETSGPVRVLHRRVVCREADAAHAIVELRAVLHTVDDRTATVRTGVAGQVDEAAHRLAAGENRIEWRVLVADPQLWWPHALGDQPLHDVTVEVLDEEGRCSDGWTVRTGFRSVRMDDWVTSVNGERLFLKGASQGPIDVWLAEAGRDRHRAVLSAAREARLDLVRVHGHVGRPELYDVADELGLLLWQDLPLQRGYHRSVRRQAVRQAREAVDLLGHHPSVAMWCGHSRPLPVDPGSVDLGDRRAVARLARREVVDQEVPIYNRSVLDRSIARALRKADRSRPVIAHSGVLPSLPKLDGTDAELSFGWADGDERRLPEYLAAWPRRARFVSGFGAQSVPEDADFVDPSAWPDLDWERLEAHRSLQKARFDEHVPPAAFATFEEWAAATRRYQADLVRHHVEALRRLKYRPTGGFTAYLLADSAPGVTWSLRSYAGHPKEAYAALAAACAPVVVVADRPPDHLHAGEPLSWDVHVVSDLRTPLKGVRVTATLTAASGERRFGWDGDVEADDCVRVGTIRTDAPSVEGPLVLDLELVHPAVTAANRYETTVVAGHHDHP
jgi:beta-mannosidase